MARSSANPICLAASLSGCQSASWAPRSTESISSRLSVNGTRSRTSGWGSRRGGMTPAAGHVGGEGPLGLLLELRPGGVRDGGELAIEVVHGRVLLLRLPIPSEPLDSGVF